MNRQTRVNLQINKKCNKIIVKINVHKHLTSGYVNFYSSLYNFLEKNFIILESLRSIADLETNYTHCTYVS